jgi:hypothetical protein
MRLSARARVAKGKKHGTIRAGIHPWIFVLIPEIEGAKSRAHVLQNPVFLFAAVFPYQRWRSLRFLFLGLDPSAWIRGFSVRVWI